MGKHSLYIKIVLFTSALAIIPLIALGFFSFMKSSNSIQNHVNQSNILIMDQANNNIEQLLRTVDYTLNYVINTKQLQESLDRNLTYYDFEFYYNMKEELSLLQSPETKVTDVILANSQSNWLINNRGLYTFDEYPSKETLLSLMELDTNTSWVILETEKLGSGDTLSYACPYTITLVKKMPIHTSQKRGLALATIPSCSLASMIEKHLESQEIMVTDEQFRIIVHPDSDKTGMLLTDAGYVINSDLARFEDRSGQFETNIGNEPISVTYVRSEFNGWIYASITEMAEITKEAKSIGWFTVNVCLLIIAISVCFIWLGSRKVYSPIRKILQTIAERLPQTQANKKNELQIIDEHIRDLFASNTHLNHELHQNSQQLRTFFLHKLFQGQLRSSEIEKKTELFGFAKQVADWEYLAVFTLQIDILEETRYEQKDVDLLLFAINNIIEEMVPSFRRLPPVFIDQTQVMLVGCEGMELTEFNNYLYKLTEEIQQNMRLYLDLVVSIGISLPFRSIQKASDAYQEGLEALKHRLILGKGVVIPYFSLNSGQHNRIHNYPMQVQSELIDSIKLADESRAYELLKQWLDEVFQKERKPHEYQISLIRLLNELMFIMQEIGIDDPLPRGRTLYEDLLQLYVSSEIENWFKSRIILPMISAFRDRQESQFQNLSEQIIEIIRNEYDTDITLEACASRLYYNNFYLSSVFKKETNMTFSDYLCQYRFKMSKKWLIETDMTVKEIAERLTYNNPQNFIRFFKKLGGMTPGQYRREFG